MAFAGLLRQSTAKNKIIGPFVSSTDGDTEMTGLTIAQADVRLSKNAGAAAQKNDNTTCAHEGDGFYMCELDATDTDTVGDLTLWVHVATALAVRHDFTVVEEAVFDALYASSALGYVANAPVSVAQIAGDTQSATDLKDFADAGYDPSTNKVQGVVLTDTVTTYTGNTVQTGDSFARIGLPAGASVSADIAAIEAQTDDIGANGAGLTAVPWNAAWDAEAQSEVQDAIEANHLDHLLAVTFDPASKPGAADALLNELVESDSGVARFTANALEQAPAAEGGLNAEEIADAVAANSKILTVPKFLGLK